MAIKARAQKTLTKIFDGSGVFSIIATNENTSIPISNQGLPLNYSSTPTDVYVYSGTSLLTPVASNPEAGQFTLTASGENISAGLVTINGNHASLANASNMTVGKTNYSITLTASGKDFLGNPFSAQKKQVITPLKRGDDATSYWENVSSSVITKDVKGNMTPDSTTVSAVYQSGMADPDSYAGIFKAYLKSGVNFSTTPDYISSTPEQLHKITPKSDTNDIKVELYDATGTNLLDIQTVPVISQANGVISTKIVYTVTSSQVQPNDSANWSDTVPTVGKGQYLWTKTTFYYTDGSNAVAYSMGSNGKDGASAALLTLVADSQIVTFDSDGSTPIPASQTITLTAILQNLTGTATFVATPYSGTAAGTPVTLGGTGNMRTLTASQFGSQYDSISVKATLGNLSDTETIHKLSNGGTGKDAITGWLTNEAITVQADSNGNVPSFTSATGSFVVYNGTSQVTGLAITQSGATGMTLSISGMNYSVTGMSQDNAYVDLSVTTSGVTIKKRLSISKSKAGATGANGTSVVNSTTPPSNPAEGQWWNDLSVTPNILKVYQKGSWTPYRIDAVNLVSGSVKTSNLSADVLLASNVTYTNSNGTTTNLQTFDFDGIKTLLSDNKGNTYSSMDTAVSSTQSWTSLSKQVNSLGQTNQLFNTEFTPDLQGWNDQTLAKTGVGTFNGSNILDLSANSDFRQLFIPLNGATVVSASVYRKISISGGSGGRWSLMFYGANNAFISSVYGTYQTSLPDFTLEKLESVSVPSGAQSISFRVYSDGTVSTHQIVKPMLVFSDNVGTYIQGNYNNNDRVLKIEKSADDFQISIGQSVKDAKSSADSANTNLSNASQSGIRYLRFRGEGNTDNQASHFGNISVFNTVGTDILAGKTATTIGNPTISGEGLGAATDGKYNTSYLGIEYNATNHEQYIVFDLGSLRYDVNKIEIGMWTPVRTYYGVKAQSSTDGNTWQTIYVGNITPNQLVGNATTGQVVGTTISFGMDTSTVLKLTADNYSMGIDANGNLVSGISGNKQQVTLKGNVIHLDGNTVAGPDFFSLWNGKYGSTTIDSTGMEVRAGLSKTKFTNGNMQFITDLGENIGYIGRQVDSVHNNLDYLTFGLNGWHTTYPGDSHYDGGSDFYGGDGMLFGISNADGGYSPLLQWNSQLAANYRSAKSGWLFTQPIIGETTFYPNDMNSDSDGLVLKKMTLDGVPYPTYSSTSSSGSAGLAIGIGESVLYAGNTRLLQARDNGYLYYMTKKTGSAGVNLKMAPDGAIIGQSSATKYKADIEYEKDTSHGDRLLTLDPATWSDAVQKEQIEEYNRTGKEPDYAMNKDGDRFYGLIAEDLVKAGLEDLVVRDTNTGSVEGIQYEKIGIALIPLVREQRNQINELRVEIERLKEKNNE